MSSVCWCSYRVLRETTAACWPCSASTSASCCNWGSAPVQLPSKAHSNNTTSESSVYTTCFKLPVAEIGLSSQHYSLVKGSRWGEDLIFQVNFRTCQAHSCRLTCLKVLQGSFLIIEINCCDCVYVCVRARARMCACVHVFGRAWWSDLMEVFWQALLLWERQRKRQFITFKQQTGLGPCPSDI